MEGFHRALSATKDSSKHHTIPAACPGSPSGAWCPSKLQRSTSPPRPLITGSPTRLIPPHLQAHGALHLAVLAAAVLVEHARNLLVNGNEHGVGGRGRARRCHHACREAVRRGVRARATLQAKTCGRCCGCGFPC